MQPGILRPIGQGQVGRARLDWLLGAHRAASSAAMAGRWRCAPRGACDPGRGEEASGAKTKRSETARAPRGARRGCPTPGRARHHPRCQPRVDLEIGLPRRPLGRQCQNQRQRQGWPLGRTAAKRRQWDIQDPAAVRQQVGEGQPTQCDSLAASKGATPGTGPPACCRTKACAAAPPAVPPPWRSWICHRIRSGMDPEGGSDPLRWWKAAPRRPALLSDRRGAPAPPHPAAGNAAAATEGRRRARRAREALRRPCRGGPTRPARQNWRAMKPRRGKDKSGMVQVSSRWRAGSGPLAARGLLDHGAPSIVEATYYRGLLHTYLWSPGSYALFGDILARARIPSTASQNIWTTLCAT